MRFFICLPRDYITLVLQFTIDPPSIMSAMITEQKLRLYINMIVSPRDYVIDAAILIDNNSTLAIIAHFAIE